MSQHFNGTRKDYAHSLGLANKGKGRMSREAHAAIDAAIAKGMTFNDARPASPVLSKSKAHNGPDKPKDDGPKDEVQNPYAEAFYRYPRDQRFTYDDPKGKRVVIAGKAACMNCGYSLIGHTCNDPVVITYHGQQSVKPVGE